MFKDKTLFNFVQNWRSTKRIKTLLTEDKKEKLIDCGILDEARVEKAMRKV
jgi:hypothetical protein